MPITGRPSKTWSLKPSVLSHERWAKPSRSRRPNQLRLRSGRGGMGALLRRLIIENRRTRMRLAGKVAIVSGGGSGIGRGIVLALAPEGSDILIPAIQPLNAEKVAYAS